SVTEQIPYDPAAQRTLTRTWARVVAGHEQLGGGRALVRDSWTRSANAAVRADLPGAPLVLNDDSLENEREHADWLPFAYRAVDRQGEALATGHILSLFDARGLMLSCQGDPNAREGLSRINFRAGALWTEGAAGTNGPGTALATGRAVHIVGAEHYCEAWHDWHCAAVPLRDEITGEILGIIDISGFRRYAHPHTLDLAQALASLVQQLLALRESERRFAVMQCAAQMAARYAGDMLVAVDRGGRVLFSSSNAPDGLRPGTMIPERLRVAIANHVRAGAPSGELSEVRFPLADDVGLSALSHLVVDGRTPVGACLLLRSGATSCASEDEAERAATIAALSRAPTMAVAAARLHIHRSTLYRRLERYGLHPERSLDSR
ncbi:MAG: GAF domain-containing protein, partial [Gemmatimonadaceae bacterium]|nr:GAF domain-containing protein [Gemmatimonadaceae bacterium]